MIRKIIAIILVNIFILNYGFSFSQGVLSLEPLLKEARENNPDILAARKRWEASKARIPQAKSLEDPSIGLVFKEAKGSPFRLNKTMPRDRMLSINQAIPWFGKLSLKGKIALVESQMIAGEYRNKELEIINEVKQAYYDLFMNHKKTGLNQASRIFFKEIVEIAEAKYVVGDIEQEDLFKLNLELSKLNNDIDNLKQERGAIETRLNALLNRKPDALLDAPELEEGTVAKLSLRAPKGRSNLVFEIASVASLPRNDANKGISQQSQEGFLFSRDLDGLYRLALENQPELLIFSYAIEKNKYAKSLAKKSFLPDIMTGVVMRGITTGTIGPWDLMLAFTVPLWFWTKQRYEVQEAISNLEEAQSAYSAMKNRAIAEVKDLAVKVRIAQNKINLCKNTLIPLVEGSIEVSRSAYLSGKGDIMMLLDSERMLIEAKMDYYSALVEYHMNFADLERTVGVNLRHPIMSSDEDV